MAETPENNQLTETPLPACRILDQMRRETVTVHPPAPAPGNLGLTSTSFPSITFRSDGRGSRTMS